MTLSDDEIRAIADRVAQCVSKALLADRVDQAVSTLGPRRHISFVRRLIRAGDPRAVRIGRRYLATRDAVDGEARRLAKCRPEALDHDVDRLAGELGLEERREKD